MELISYFLRGWSCCRVLWKVKMERKAKKKRRHLTLICSVSRSFFGSLWLHLFMKWFDLIFARSFSLSLWSSLVLPGFPLSLWNAIFPVLALLSRGRWWMERKTEEKIDFFSLFSGFCCSLLNTSLLFGFSRWYGTFFKGVLNYWTPSIWVSTEFYRVLPGFTGFYRVLPIVAVGLWGTEPSCCWFYWPSLNFTGCLEEVKNWISGPV